MIRNNYDLIPEIRCESCGWYSVEDGVCTFWDQIHNPDGFCDEGVGKCCMNCAYSVGLPEYEMCLCLQDKRLYTMLYICDGWEQRG